jgi:hypothetical protein
VVRVLLETSSSCFIPLPIEDVGQGSPLLVLQVRLLTTGIGVLTLQAYWTDVQTCRRVSTMRRLARLSLSSGHRPDDTTRFS